MQIGVSPNDPVSISDSAGSESGEANGAQLRGTGTRPSSDLQLETSGRGMSMAPLKSYPRPWHVEKAVDAFLVVDINGSVVARIGINDHMTQDCAQYVAERMVENAERLENASDNPDP